MSFRKPIKPVNRHMEEWIQPIKSFLGDPPDLIIEHFETSEKDEARGYTLIYLKNMVDIKALSDQLLKPLFELNKDFTVQRLQEILPISNIQQFKNVEELGNLLYKGFVAVLEQGTGRGIAVNVSADIKRSLQEPEFEKIILGPHIGFNENIPENIALLRKFVDTPQLRIKKLRLNKSEKDVYIAYIDGTADPDLIQEVEKRLQKVKVKDLLDPHYLEEWLVDDTFSPFPNFYYTERPDSTAANLIEGKIALFIPNSPVMAIIPISFTRLLMAPDDHYYNPFLASMIRSFRLISLIIAFSISSFYVALSMVNHELMPFLLIQSVIQAREGVPFPTLVEVLLLEFALEIVIEASRWTPGNIAQAITLFGTIIIGQAAVQAGLLDATVIIVIALEAIASFAVPLYRGSVLIRLLRYPMIIFASIFGVVGIGMYVLFLVIHLIRKENFGYPYMSPLAPFNLTNFKDSLIRVPRKFMNRGTLTERD